MDMTLRDQEREAFMQGDHAKAELLAIAMEQEAMEETLWSAQASLDGIQAAITEANWRTGKKTELRELIEEIISILDK